MAGMRSAMPMTQVELAISCKSLRDRDALSKSDPMCVLSVKQFGSDSFHEDQRTERIKNTLNPEFSRKFTLNYFFEEAQKLRFDIYDIDSETSKLSAHDFLGRLDCTLGEIIGAPGSKIHRQLTGGSAGVKSGSIVVAAEEISGSKEVAWMQWHGSKLDKKDTFGKSDPFLMFYRINDDNSRTLLHRTEVIKNSLNPVWKPLKLPVRSLVRAQQQERQIVIDCYDHDEDGGQVHDLIGTCQTTLSKLRQGSSTNIYDLLNPKKQAKKKGYKNSGHLQLASISFRTEYSFLDYVRGGVQIHYTVAVDFTASNGTPTDPRSLHYIHPHQPNQYMIALKSVGEIIQDYDADKMFPSLGFGAMMPGGQVSHEFFLNFDSHDPHCRGVDGILSAYRQAIMQVQLYGPTNFSPVINHVAKFAAASASQGTHYFVLLIITDGVITDFEQTKFALVNASTLPMSVIIVGVGNDDFEAMDALDADKHLLTAQGRRAERDIVQFVPFRKYMTQNYELSQAKLAKDVLKEIPNQLVTWMQARGLQPRPPPQVDLSQVQGNFQQMNLGGGGGQPTPGNTAPFAPGAGQVQPGHAQNLPSQQQPQYPPGAGQTPSGPGQYPPSHHQPQYPPFQGQSPYAPQAGLQYPAGHQGGQYPAGQPQGGQYPAGQPQGGQYPAGQPQGGQYPAGHQGGQYPAGQPQGGQYPAGHQGGQYPAGQSQGQYGQPAYPGQQLAYSGGGVQGAGYPPASGYTQTPYIAGQSQVPSQNPSYPYPNPYHQKP